MNRTRITARQKAEVFRRARGYGEYCRCPASHTPDSFAVEHIHPRALGGTNTLDNLALSCQGCNSAKYTRTEADDPLTGETVPLFHPRLQRWTDHFGWSEEMTRIVGLTRTGRATVEALKVNREGAINLRRVLYTLRQHPPQEPEDEG